MFSQIKAKLSTTKQIGDAAEDAALHYLQHDAIVRYYAFTVEPVLQRSYLAMEFVDGRIVDDCRLPGFTPQRYIDGLVALPEGVRPQDVYARLSAAGPHASGVQIGRHEVRRPVVHGKNVPGVGVEPIDGCGYGCLLTTGEAYKAAKAKGGDGLAIITAW